MKPFHHERGDGKEKVASSNDPLPFDPLTRPRAEPSRKSAKKKKKKAKQQVKAAIAALSANDNDMNDDVPECDEKETN